MGDTKQVPTWIQVLMETEGIATTKNTGNPAFDAVNTLPSPTISPQDALNEWAAVLIVIAILLIVGVISEDSNTVAKWLFVLLIVGMILAYSKRG